MIVTEAQHSQRHIPPADSANPTHSSGVDALIRKACTSESGSDPSLKDGFPPGALPKCTFWIAQCHAPRFCERVKRKASCRDRMWNLTWPWDVAPAGTAERLHISLLLGMIQPFLSRQLYRLVLACEKRPLLVSFGTGSSVAAASGFFWETYPCNGEIKPPPPSFCKVQTEPRHKQWNECSAEAMSSSGRKHPCSMFPSPQTSGKRKSRAPRQMFVKLINSSQNSPQSQYRYRRKACTGAVAVWEPQLGMLAGEHSHRGSFCSGCAITQTKQRPLLMAQTFWWNPFTSQQHLCCISTLIPGNDAGWREFNHWDFLQERPRLPISVPRQGPDRRGLPQLQSEVPVWQIWYVPHLWKPDQRAAEILSSHDWLFLGVRTTSVISPS